MEPRRNLIGCLCLGTALALTSLGCSDDKSESDGGGVPRVGDPYDDGTVTSVSPNGECFLVTIHHDPAWTCSSSQLQEASQYFEPPSDPGGPPNGTESVPLVPSTCDGLANLRRPVIKKSQRDTLAQRRWSTLATNCLGHDEYRSIDENGDACVNTQGTGGYGGGAMADASSSSSGSAGGTSEEGAEEYSTTNNQVADVDEADFIKNDAEHVYVLSSDGLHIIDAWPAPEAHEVAHLAVRGEPRRLFLAGDRLLVYSRLGANDGSSYGTQSPSDSGCTYGYDCRFTSEGGHVLVQAYDVTDPSHPVALHSYETSGAYVSSRRIGTSVYTVVHDYGVSSAPGVDLDLDATDPGALEEEYQAKLAAADAAIDTLPAKFFLPWVREVDAQGNTMSEVTSCNRALASGTAQGQSFVSVVGLDIQDPTALTRTIVAARAGFVYASASSLYLANDGVDGSDSYSYYSSASDDRSSIHKFALDGLDVRYAGSTAIPGHVLNQFSMDEFEGVLRVATSSGWVPDPDVVSNVTTIVENNGELKILGALTGLAPMEDIRSVRFDGERAFVVTFKKTDPLFVIDLSEPSAPSVLGELKIPGFSTYMHPLDANHLLAVGFDADEQGSFAYFEGIQIQIFDVTELSNPLLMHKTTIGTRGSASEALLNHLAFNYFPPKAMLAMPMTICEGGDNGVYGDLLTFSGLMVFDVSLTGGITEHGRMPFANPDEANTYYGGCGQWWSDGKSDVKRSIFMDNYVMGISDDTFAVAELSDMSSILQSISLESTP